MTSLPAFIVKQSAEVNAGSDANMVDSVSAEKVAPRWDLTEHDEETGPAGRFSPPDMKLLPPPACGSSPPPGAASRPAPANLRRGGCGRRPADPGFFEPPPRLVSGD